MNNKIIAAIGIYISTSGEPSEVSDNRNTITVSDIAGNKVTIRSPLERVAITSSDCIDVYMAIAGDSWLDNIVLLPSDIETREPQKYQILLDKYPEIANIKRCPDLYLSSSFPAESILSAEPDLVLVPKATMDWMGYNASSYKILTNAGIGVMYIDYYTNPYDENVAENNFMPLGKILGKESRAQEIVEYYDEQIKSVTDIIDSIPKGDIKVYAEIMNQSISEYGSTGIMGFQELELLGLTNVSKVATEYFNLERLQAANPDLIIIAVSTYFGTEEGKYLGYGAHPSEEMLYELAAEYANRDNGSWNNLKAVQNKNLYFYYPELGFTPAAFLKIQTLAKVVYPEYFEDMDPIANLNEYYDRFMPIDADGT